VPVSRTTRTRSLTIAVLRLIRIGTAAP